MNIQNKIKYKCGCVAIEDIVHVSEKSKYHSVAYDIYKYVLDTFCSKHKPNYAKKADKIIRNRNKKRGRGYTTKQQKNVRT